MGLPWPATVLALANDPDHKVQLILDRTVAETGHFGRHPLHQYFDSKPLYGRGTEDAAACLGDCPLLVDLPDPRDEEA